MSLNLAVSLGLLLLMEQGTWSKEADSALAELEKRLLKESEEKIEAVRWAATHWVGGWVGGEPVARLAS